jgi:hypothetical protein
MDSTVSNATLYLPYAWWWHTCHLWTLQLVKLYSIMCFYLLMLQRANCTYTADTLDLTDFRECWKLMKWASGKHMEFWIGTLKCNNGLRPHFNGMMILCSLLFTEGRHPNGKFHWWPSTCKPIINDWMIYINSLFISRNML